MEMSREQRAEFARRLNEKFRSLGWTQDQLADASGLGLRTVNSFVRGSNVPNEKTLVAIAAAVGIDPVEVRAQWSEKVQIFLDLMGVWLNAQPEIAQRRIMMEFAQQIADASTREAPATLNGNGPD